MMLAPMAEIYRYGEDYGRNIGQRGGNSALSTSFWEPYRRQFSFISARITGEVKLFFFLLKYYVGNFVYALTDYCGG